MRVIWGRDNSVNVQKVLWCCEELAIEYKRLDAGMNFGVVNTPEYRALNPNGLVPTLDEDGFVLWESNTIVRYLAATHARGGLWPDDPRARAHAEQWMDWQNSTYWPAMRPLFMGLVRTEPAKRDPLALETHRLAVLKLMEILDAHLQSHPYMGGDAFTMGDIPVGCGVWRWMGMPIQRPALPNLQRWFDALAQRPAFRKTVMQPLS
ncbi:MAG: glutathione S-transferase [Betaproteobacteria bacterium]|nr:glutathione S-transferase [Betaproteobacteria bacterium]